MICRDVTFPATAVHISQSYTGLLTTYQEIILAVLAIKHPFQGLCGDTNILTCFHEGVDGTEGFVHLLLHALQC